MSATLLPLLAELEGLRQENLRKRSRRRRLGLLVISLFLGIMAFFRLLNLYQHSQGLPLSFALEPASGTGSVFLDNLVALGVLAVLWGCGYYALYARTRQSDFFPLAPLKRFVHARILPAYLNEIYPRAAPYTRDDALIRSRYLFNREKIDRPDYFARTPGGNAKLHILRRGLQRYDVEVEDEWILRDKQEREFKIAEFYLERVTHAVNGEFKRVPYATFVVVEVGVDQEFSGATYLHTRSLVAPKFKDLEIAKLESSLFARNFEVRTSNQREARLVLKTNVIDALNSLASRHERVFLEFADRKVIIGVQAKQAILEPTLYREFTIANLEEFNAQLQALTSLARALKINYRSRGR